DDTERNAPIQTAIPACEHPGKGMLIRYSPATIPGRRVSQSFHSRRSARTGHNRLMHPAPAKRRTAVNALRGIVWVGIVVSAAALVAPSFAAESQAQT